VHVQRRKGLPLGRRPSCFDLHEALMLEAPHAMHILQHKVKLLGCGAVHFTLRTEGVGTA